MVLSFDTIPHANLMATVAERICDGEILRLTQMWLKAPIMEMDKDGTKRNIGGGKGNRKGTPQGGVISPLLSNLYLHILDRIWERNKLQQKLGVRIVSYADDIVILCRRNKSGKAMALWVHKLDGRKQQKWESVPPCSAIKESLAGDQRSCHRYYAP